MAELSINYVATELLSNTQTMQLALAKTCNDKKIATRVVMEVAQQIITDLGVNASLRDEYTSSDLADLALHKLENRAFVMNALEAYKRDLPNVGFKAA